MSRGPEREDITPPTPEQLRRAVFEVEDVVDKRRGGGTVTIGKAYKRRPMVDVLALQGMFSDAEYKALKHYRHCADTADRSPLRDSLNRQRGGSGEEPADVVLMAASIAGQCERAAGSLAPILRAVIVDDKSLSEWAMEQRGSVEVCRTRRGKRVCTPEPKRKALEIAQLEIKMAAKRVEAELGS